MSISGINNYNYPNYYAGARHNMAKTGGRDSGVLSSTSSASSNITLHMSDGGNSGNALTAMGFPDGTSASVFKADDYNPADPEYRVRYWDKEGNYTDTNVQINGVNPRNASYLEMLAYTTYSDVEGFTKNAFGDFMNAARGVNGNISYDADNIFQAGFSDMIDEYVHFNDSARNSIMERMTPDYMVVGIGSKTESYKYKSEIISDETAFYTNEKNEISGICNQFLNGKTDQKLFCNEMKDRLNDYYGSRYELRNQSEAVEGRVSNMLSKLQHMYAL